MLAICGLIAPEFVRVPGEIFQDVSVLDAHNVMVSAPRPPVVLFFSVEPRKRSTRYFLRFALPFFCVILRGTTAVKIIGHEENPRQFEGW